MVFSYFNELKSWYTSFKSKSSGKLHDKLTQMAVDIDETKQFVHRKR